VVSAAHRCVGELAYKLKSSTLSECRDGLALALVAFFLGAGICGA
jgi:hypothetical protein